MISHSEGGHRANFLFLGTLLFVCWACLFGKSMAEIAVFRFGFPTFAQGDSLPSS